MCAALSHLPMENTKNTWSFIMESAPTNGKLSSFVDYFLNQWMDNLKLSFEILNVHRQRHRENNTVEGYNSKLNREIGKAEPNVHIL